MRVCNVCMSESIAITGKWIVKLDNANNDWLLEGSKKNEVIDICAQCRTLLSNMDWQGLAKRSLEAGRHVIQES